MYRVLSSDEEGNMPKRSKGKGKERARRKSPELTPPPELTAEDRASINELLRSVSRRILQETR